MKKAIPVIIAILLIVVIGAVTLAGMLMEKYSYSKERVELAEYYGLTAEQADSWTAVYLQDERLEQLVPLRDGKCYFPMDMVHQYFNDTFYADRTEGLLLYALPMEVVRVELGSSVERRESGSEDVGYVIAYEEGGQVYIAADYVQRYSNMTLQYAQYHVQVYNKWGRITEATVTKDTAVRIKGGIKSEILWDAAAGSRVKVLDQMETWSKVRTEDGYIGYVENKLLADVTETQEIPVTDYVEPEYSSLRYPGKVSMGWHSIGGVGGNDTLESMVAGTRGMNVIAPTWFSLSDNEGNFQSFASSSYVERAHGMGLQVWGVLDDFNYNNVNQAGINDYQILSSTTIRGRLIDNIVQEALNLNLDGLNIDFEKVTKECSDHYAQFIRELSIACRKGGLILSFDNYVPFNFNDYYRRDVQGKVADYVIIMGYDEHWHGSGDPGSVASIGYVSGGIDRTLEQVPKEKVINALPFYTILWTIDGAIVTDEYLLLSNTKDYLQRINVEASWDEETSQLYAEWQSGSKTHKLWAETEESIQVKLNVMQTKDIAGVAVWQISYGTPEVWELISAYVNAP
ncbi:MAG: SH3 domain-containing protein [Acetatifactor sp.]|nr:SH3 domain-containing protein [Acetatifactor sp.]